MEKNLAYKALETIGWGRYNLTVYIICGMAWFSYDSWYLNMGFSLQGLHEEWGLSPFLLGVIAAIFQCGILFGSLTWGMLSDKKGRKFAYQLSCFIVFFASIFFVVSVNPYMAASGLFLVGFGLSGEIGLTGTFFCEFCPPTKRYLITSLSLFFSFGSIFTSSVALVIESLNESDVHSWRIITGMLVLTSLGIFVLRMFAKETPAYLFGKQRIRESEAVLNMISMKNNNKEFQFEDLSSIATQYKPMEAGASVNSPLTPFEGNPSPFTLFKKLFGRKLIWTTLKLSIAQTLSTFSFAGYFFFMPELLTFLPKSEAYTIILLQQFVGIPGVLLGTWLVETRLGRKNSTTIFFILAGSLSVVFYFNENFYFVAAITSLIYFCAFLGYATLLTLGPESFPTQVRSTGYGTVNILSRTGGICAPLAIGGLLSGSNGKLIVLGLLGGGYFLSGLIVMLMKETRLKVKDDPLVEHN